MVRRWLTRFFLFSSCFFLFSACVTNPVTGKKDVGLVTPEMEVRLGEQHYYALQQAEGGLYTVDPAVGEYVSSIGQSIALASDRPDLPYAFVVLDNPIPNAWALPGGKIGINVGLLAALESEAQLAAVLGHEVVHAAARHTAQAMERNFLIQMGLNGITQATQYDLRRNKVVLNAAAMGVHLLNLKYSRHAELEADRYGISTMHRAGYDPQGAVQVQELFWRMQENQSPHWLEGLLSSHPPSQERIVANRATARTFKEGGKIGKENYTKMMETVFRSKPAYERYQEGLVALGEKRYSDAIDLARQAQSIEPREPHFYALQGAAEIELYQFTQAVHSYGVALQHNQDYYDYYLQRGVAKERMGYYDGAYKDVERSLNLLPTDAGYFVLGDIERKRGNIKEAVEHYHRAAQSPSDIGTQAKAWLAKVDIPLIPSRYFDIKLARTYKGYVTLEVTNNSPIPVEQIIVLVEVYDAKGWAVTRYKVRFPYPLMSNESSFQATTIGPYPTDELMLERIKVRVHSAKSVN